MFVILYRWKLKPHKESQFIEGWSEVTDYFRANHDSLGSRLHRGDDGVFYGYAQWESAEAREIAFKTRPELNGNSKMREAIIESLEPIILEIMADYLVYPEKNEK